MKPNHIRISRNKRSQGAFNIQMINSYHSYLKEMIIHRLTAYRLST